MEEKVNLAEEMPPALDDSSGGDVLRLHWENIIADPVYAAPVCCCPPQTNGDRVINAGCQVHGLKSYEALRSSGSQHRYGFAR